MSWREYKTNICSRLSFYWTTYLLNNDITPDIIDELSINDQSQILLDKFLKIWDENNEYPSIFMISIKVMGIWRSLRDLLGWIIAYIGGAIIWILFYEMYYKTMEHGSVPTEYFIAVIVLIFLRSNIQFHTGYGSRVYSLQIKQLIMTVILHKSFKINSNNIEAGKVLNMLNKDTNAIYEIVYNVYVLVSVLTCLLTFVITMAVLTKNYMLFISFGVIFVMFVISVVLGVIYGIFQQQTFAFTDESMCIGYVLYWVK